LEGFESFVGVNFWTALFTLCNMIISFLVLKKLLFKPVKTMIDSRQAEIAKIYEDANHEKAEAQRLREEYAESISGAREEAEQIVKDAHQKAQVRSAEIVSEAQQKAAHLLQKAEEDIEREKKKTINEIKDEISDIAIMIASKVVEKDIDEKEHEQLISQFIDRAGDPTWKA